MLRRYGEPPRRGTRYRFRPGAYAVITGAAGVLLTFQQWPDAEFQLPGGGVDPGEHPIAALHREVLEETGWAIATPRRLGAYRRFCYMPDYHRNAEKLCTIWLARGIAQRSAPREEGHFAYWLPPAEALPLLPDPGARAVLAGAMRAGLV